MQYNSLSFNSNSTFFHTNIQRLFPLSASLASPLSLSLAPRPIPFYSILFHSIRFDSIPFQILFWSSPILARNGTILHSIYLWTYPTSSCYTSWLILSAIVIFNVIVVVVIIHMIFSSLSTSPYYIQHASLLKKPRPVLVIMMMFPYRLWHRICICIPIHTVSTNVEGGGIRMLQDDAPSFFDTLSLL